MARFVAASEVESYIKSEEYGIVDGPVGPDIRRMAARGEKYCRVSLHAYCKNGGRASRGVLN